MKDLLLVVPSRGRPGNIARLWDAMEQTCHLETGLIVGLDEDDPTRDSYPPGLPYMIRPGLHNVVPWINELAKPYIGDYRYIGHIGDDNVPRTDGWDTAICEALEETPFAFGNDLYPRAPGSLCCHVFMRSDVVRTLGYFGPPGIRHMYVDVAWYAWGKACGITYLHDVIIEHMHFTAGKSDPDGVYAASQGLIPVDLRNWHAYSRNGDGLNGDIRKLGGRPFSPAELAAFNTELFIPETL